MYDVVALGELLIDFTPAGVSPAGNTLFERNPGGAPANVLSAVSKLGGTGAFLGKVGNDQFGLFLKSVLEQNGIGTRGLKFSPDVHTTLAFVQLDEHGDRSFSFYRKPGADMTLAPEDLELGLIDEARIFHFGSLSLTDEPARSATKAALEYARKKGKVVSYDPNWRPPLWENDAQAKQAMLSVLPYADILKVSEEELAFLTGETDIRAGGDWFLRQGAKIVVVTLGPRGCYFCSAAGSAFRETYDTKIVDTTGSGDCFFGAMLAQLAGRRDPLDSISEEELEHMVDFANAAGALCATRKGAISSMPDRRAIEACMHSVPLLHLKSAEAD